MERPSSRLPDRILTIGHSNRTLEEFIDLLQTHRVALLVDIRTVPRSRYNPQFNRDALPADLEAVRISYQHMPGLGGLRHARPDSPNTGWRNASFQGFADYMQTPEFAASLQELIQRVDGQTAALMCAEAVPWRCHRSLVADALTLRGVRVEDIFSAAPPRPHVITSWAHVDGIRITYPPDAASPDPNSPDGVLPLE
jgi:uncharacterized protein (DUF488 family)